MTLAPGTRIRRYEVSALLGAGGMGEVYLARDVELNRSVALKILPHLGDEKDDERMHRFLQEAKAVISLSHPNVAHIYDAGDENGVRFMAMEYVQGETLRARILRERLALDEAIDITLQVASALASAHGSGIVHRDIKPENVMIRPDGYVKVLDFGLAKWTAPESDPAATEVVHTAPGVVMGTMHYMSPEQLRGGHVDARADVFSLGVMLYELSGGRRPFEASTPSGIIAAILTEDPKPLDGIPPALAAVMSKALAKDPGDRYPSAREMSDALKRPRAETDRIRSGDVPTQVLTQPVEGPPRRRWTFAAVALLLLIGVAIGSWAFLRQRKIAEARAALPRVEQLAEQARYFEAWDLAQSLRTVLGNEERLTRALQKMSEELTVETDSAGAHVYLRRILADGSDGPREHIGTTPVAKHAVPRGNYILTVAKDGYAESVRPLNMQPMRIGGHLLQQPPPVVKLQLLKNAEVPERMVFVEGGNYELTGWMQISDAKVRLEPFFIDRYEVSNREFEQFIRAGGYRRRDLWAHPFMKDGKTLSFEEAIVHFRDATGLPGPRRWAQGKYPQGQENHPVTDITWYEAAAYAAHAGKKLPTVFQWDKAARNGMRAWAESIFPWGMTEPGANITLRANFRGAGPLPVDSLAAGMSMWGAHHLAGNVAEMLRNRLDDGFAATGGGFDDPTYQFGNVAAYPGFYSSPSLGFRCVRETAASGADQGAFALVTRRIAPPAEKPVNDAEFARLRRVYEYAPLPLNAKVIERIDTADWVREKVSYTGAQGKTAIVYVYLPKGVKPPYQMIHFFPAGDVHRGARTLPMALEGFMPAIIRGGRGVFGVVLEGFLERKPVTDSSEDENELTDDIVDLRRALDYVTSRPDVAPAKIGYVNPSAGLHAFILNSVDERYAAVAYIASAFARTRQPAPEQNRVNFIPRIHGSKMVIHGKYDEVNPLPNDGQPIFDLLRPPKELKLYDGGHIPTTEWLIPELIAWYDKVLGPVGQEWNQPTANQSSPVR